MVICWLQRFATGNKEPGYIGKVMQTALGLLFQEDFMIIVGIDIAFQKHDYFMILKDTSVVVSSSSITIQNNERRGPLATKEENF